MEEIKIGDVVYLKSGSPAMTVNKLGTLVHVMWIYQGCVLSSVFPDACLTKSPRVSANYTI